MVTKVVIKNLIVKCYRIFYHDIAAKTFTFKSVNSNKESCKTFYIDEPHCTRLTIKFSARVY